MRNQKITHGIIQDKEKLHIQMVKLMRVDSKKVSDTTLALLLILKKEQKKQNTLTSVNGKKKKNGIGIQIYTGIGRYQGYWKNGLRDGEGVMIYTNQDVYSGSWKNGKKEGQGTYIFFETGMKYVGNFRNG